MSKQVLSQCCKASVTLISPGDVPDYYECNSCQKNCLAVGERSEGIPVYISGSSAYVDSDEALELRAHSDKLLERIAGLFETPLATQRKKLFKQLEDLEAEIEVLKEELLR